MKNKGLLLLLIPSLLVGCQGNKDVESDTKILTLSGPNEGQVIEIMRSEEKAYIDAMHQQAQGISNDYVINDLNGDTVKIKNFVQKYDSKKGEYNWINQTNGQGVNVNLGFTHKGFGEGKVYNYHIATKSDFSDERIISTKKTSLNVHSLKSNSTYYWKVTDYNNEYPSSVKTFKTTEGWRGINNSWSSNVRDMGGHMTKSGKYIKQGLVYRGSELNAAEYMDGETKHNLTITSDTLYTCKNIIKMGVEIDFRGTSESGNLTQSNIGWDVKYLRKPITAYGKLFTNSPNVFGSYIKDIFKEFITATEDKAVYFHCMGGADRTGTVGFLLGGLLGMSYTDLVIDYELTSFSYNLREHDQIGQYSDFPSLITELKNFTNATSETEISTMVETYLTSATVGLTQTEINQIKTNMLED